jgi:hypothetical protein
MAWSRIWPVLWFAWVAVLSLRLSWRRIFHTNGPLHFLGHALVFGFSAFVACRSARSLRQRLIRGAAVVAFGFALEVAESRLFGKRLEWEDILTDTFGVLLFLLAALWLDLRRTPRSATGVPH